MIHVALTGPEKFRSKDQEQAQQDDSKQIAIKIAGRITLQGVFRLRLELYLD
jgi:hypothetical protein